MEIERFALISKPLLIYSGVPKGVGQMDVTIILSIVKARLGFTSTVRDTYLTHIINSIITELTTQQGLTLIPGNAAHEVFIADYAVWRYQSRDSSGAIPRHLQFRLHNLMVSN